MGAHCMTTALENGEIHSREISIASSAAYIVPARGPQGWGGEPYGVDTVVDCVGWIPQMLLTWHARLQVHCLVCLHVLLSSAGVPLEGADQGDMACTGQHRWPVLGVDP